MIKGIKLFNNNNNIKQSQILFFRNFSTAKGDKLKASHFVKTRGSCKSISIVGLPNIGKSTFFNALTSSNAAMAANFPFCTIDPNIGKVFVPDERLDYISDLLKTKSKIGVQLEFVDVAGLIKGAAEGEGLGNKFLGNIRQTSLICHLVRCFEDKGITHVSEEIDPIRDIETIETELILADLQSLEKMLTEGKKKQSNPELQMKFDLVKRISEALHKGIPARDVEITEMEWPVFHSLHLLTSKPTIYTCNVAEGDAATGNKYTDQVKQYSKSKGLEIEPVVISAKIESELANMEGNDETKKEFLQLYGLENNGLSKVINGAYKLLGLQSYYTASSNECHAWTFKAGWTAPKAAGVIHTDFEKGFIKCDTISYNDFIECKGDEKVAKEKGKQRSEGKTYIVNDGDVLFFKFN
ncbi:hypothetical protein ACTFIV_006186 [Dictyostelium citrinum]